MLHVLVCFCLGVLLRSLFPPGVHTMDSAALASAAHAVDETQLMEQQQLAEQELAEIEEDVALLADDEGAAAQDVSTFVHPPGRAA